MLELYRRHRNTCTIRSLGREGVKCSCPIWITGDLRGTEIRKSLNTNDWREALATKDRLEDGKGPVISGTTLKDAIDAYLLHCETRPIEPLGKYTMRSYTNTLRKLEKQFGEKPINQFSVLDLDKRDNGVTSSTAKKELTHLRSFFAWAMSRGLIQDNPAKLIKIGKVKLIPTMPYTREEVKRLIESTDRASNPLMAKALILTLLYSGLRISDVVQLTSDRIGKDGRLLLRMEKTGNPVYVRLSEDVLEALNALPSGDLIFWDRDNNIEIESAIEKLRKIVKEVGLLAGVANARPHRFRDTFAVTLLLNGVDIRTVSILLGHKTIKTTEEHYAPFVKEFQERLDNATATLKW